MKTISLSNFKVGLRPPLLSNLKCSVTVACLEDRTGPGGVPGAQAADLLASCAAAVFQLGSHKCLVDLRDPPEPPACLRRLLCVHHTVLHQGETRLGWFLAPSWWFLAAS